MQSFIQFVAVLGTLCLLGFIWWYATKKTKATLVCPHCKTATNYLTPTGKCQECEWEKIEHPTM